MVGTPSSSIVETLEVTQEILLVIEEDGLSVTNTVEAIGVGNSSFCD